jgi:hypothetical protein
MVTGIDTISREVPFIQCEICKGRFYADIDS